MFVRDALSYISTRAGVGVLGVCALAVFSRIAPPESYGFYTVVSTNALTLYTYSLSWIGIGVLRHMPHDATAKREFLSTLLIAFGLCAAGLSLIGGALVLLGRGAAEIAGLSVLLSVAIAAFDLSGHISRARNDVRAFSRKSFVRMILFIGLGCALLFMGMAEMGLIVALALSFVVTGALWARSDCQGIGARYFDKSVLHAMLRFGIPVAFAVGCSSSIDTVSRVLVYHMLGDAAAGEYGLSVDFARQPLFNIMSAAALGLLPAASRAYDEAGFEKAGPLMRQGLCILLLVSLPVLAVECLAAEPLAVLFLDARYAGSAAELMPLVALSAFLSGIRSYYLDIALHVRKKTGCFLGIWSASAVLNIVAALVLVPVLGMKGAITANIVAFLGAMLLNCVFQRGERLFWLTPRDALSIAVAVAGFCVPLTMTFFAAPLPNLAAQLLMAAPLYALALLLLNPAGCLTPLKARLQPALRIWRTIP